MEYTTLYRLQAFEDTFMKLDLDNPIVYTYNKHKFNDFPRFPCN